MSENSTKISEVYPTLTRSQRSVADFMLEHRDVMAFATLDDAAEKIGVCSCGT